MRSYSQRCTLRRVTFSVGPILGQGICDQLMWELILMVTGIQADPVCVLYTDRPSGFIFVFSVSCCGTWSVHLLFQVLSSQVGLE